jgi:hypothetical protein
MILRSDALAIVSHRSSETSVKLQWETVALGAEPAQSICLYILYSHSILLFFRNSL